MIHRFSAALLGLVVVALIHQQYSFQHHMHRSSQSCRRFNIKIISGSKRFPIPLHSSFRDASGISKHFQTLSREKKKGNIFTKLWKNTIGGVFALLVSSWRRLFGSKEDPTGKVQEETLADLKALALQDKVDERLNGAHDSIIRVNIVHNPVVADNSAVSSPVIAAAMTEEDRAAGRKVVERKLKEIEERKALVSSTVAKISEVQEAAVSELLATFPEVASAQTQDHLYDAGPADAYAVSMEESGEMFDQPQTRLATGPGPGAVEPDELAAWLPIQPASTGVATNPINTMDKVKALGKAGIAAYVLTELAFWALYPSAMFIYQHSTGQALDTSDTAAMLGFSAVFVSLARFAVPLRIGIALALAPSVDRFVLQPYARYAASSEGEGSAV